MFDLFLKWSFLVLFPKPVPVEVAKGGMRNEVSPSLMAALSRAKATVMEYHLGGSIVAACWCLPLAHMWG